MRNVLAQASAEIKTLRRANEILQAKVDTMDLLAAMVFSVPPQQRSVGMGEDVAWRLDQEIAKLDAKPGDSLT